MAILSDIVPVGTIFSSMLSEAQFQDQAGSGWILADGRSVSGSSYSTITGDSNAPDFRGHYLRGRNYARSDGAEDPTGDHATGFYQDSRNTAHVHGMTHKHQLFESPTERSAAPVAATGEYTLADGGTNRTTHIGDSRADTDSEGGTDGRPRSNIINWFIKIN